MNKITYYYIQIFAALSLVGYWLICAVCTYIVGDTPQTVSIIYRFMQLILSLTVIYICRNDLRIERENSLHIFLVLLFTLYAFRLLIDAANGPYSAELPTSTFIKDFLYTVISIHGSTFALITARKYIDINIICKFIYWFTLIIIIITPHITEFEITYYNDEEIRLDAGRGLGTLALAKIGAIGAISSIHLLINSKKYIYSIGLIAGIWLSLFSGSRGSILALIIALFYYLCIKSQRNIIYISIFTACAVWLYTNIIPILEWLYDFFPVFSNRMLEYIMYNDQSSREVIRQLAYEKIMDNPVLGFSYRLLNTSTGYTSHNGILDILLTFGIPFGLISIYYIYIKPTYMAHKLINNKQLFFPIVMTFWVIISSFASSSITDSTFCFAICIIGSVYYNKIYRYEKK